MENSEGKTIETIYTCTKRECPKLSFTQINIKKKKPGQCPSCGSTYSPTVEIERVRFLFSVLET